MLKLKLELKWKLKFMAMGRFTNRNSSENPSEKCQYSLPVKKMYIKPSFRAKKLDQEKKCLQMDDLQWNSFEKAD